MAAEAVPPDRVYQSRPQVLFGWCGAAVMVGLGLVAVVQPTARSHGGYAIAGVAVVIAVGLARFARCGVRVSAGGVRVTNMLRTTDLQWGQIREFKLSPVGACLIGLKDGRWVGIIGIEQTNWAWLTKRQHTPEKGMIAELNGLLREHDGNGDSDSAPRNHRQS
jgi:Bacterial PH domain